MTALIDHPEAGMAAAKMLLFDRRDRSTRRAMAMVLMGFHSTGVCGSEMRASLMSPPGSLVVVVALWPTAGAMLDEVGVPLTSLSLCTVRTST